MKSNHRIGTTTVAAILGVSPWATPVDAWRRITGRDPGPDDNAAMQRGRVLEEPILQLYELETGYRVERAQELVVQDPDRPWFAGHLDGIVRATPHLVEAKTTGRMSDQWGQQGTDDIPDHYLCQVQAELHLARASRQVPDVAVADVVLLYGDLRTYTVRYHPGFCASMLERLDEFWSRHVLKDVPPDPMSEEDCRALWRDANHGQPGTVLATDETIVTLREIKRLQAEAKAIDEILKAHKTQIMRVLQDSADTVVDANGKPLCTWKMQSRKSLDLAALKAAHPNLLEEYERTTSYPVFRLTTRKDSPL